MEGLFFCPSILSGTSRFARSMASFARPRTEASCPMYKTLGSLRRQCERRWCFIPPQAPCHSGLENRAHAPDSRAQVNASVAHSWAIETDYSRSNYRSPTAIITICAMMFGQYGHWSWTCIRQLLTDVWGLRLIARFGGFQTIGGGSEIPGERSLAYLPRLQRYLNCGSFA